MLDELIFSGMTIRIDSSLDKLAFNKLVIGSLIYSQMINGLLEQLPWQMSSSLILNN